MSNFAIDRYYFLKALKSPTAEQKIFIQLHENNNRTAQQDKSYKAALKYERATIRAENAKFNLDNSQKSDEDKRKAATHFKVLAGTVILDLIKKNDGIREKFFESAGVYLSENDFKQFKMYLKI
ncbi:MAG: hypothetical protein KGO49_06990 [Gammaproteobacteria bacterium]|nr:hypothetical protein [Gammaproteobacteria bacterium]